MEGHIQLKRLVMEWQWYKEPKTAFLFIHLLLTANHTIGKWKGVTVLRGQLVTSINHLSSNTGLSIKNIRTAFQHLEKTKDIIRKSASQYTLITICTYDEYIECLVKGGKKVAHHSQTSDIREATNNNDDNEDNEKKPIYSAFYDHEINESGNDQNYISAVKILYGENNLGIKLSAVLAMKEQLSYKQFQTIWYLRNKYKFSIMEVLEEMENWGNPKKNTTIYRTFLTFIKRRNPEISLS